MTYTNDAHSTSATGARLRESFDALIEVPPSDRAAWLDAHIEDAGLRSALRDLVLADDAAGFLDVSVVAHASRLRSEEIQPDGLIGQQIGMFRLVRLLGQGGMAAVFLGERIGSDFKQSVALKILRRGLYSDLEQRLFLRERQVLAGLSHPNVARMIDGGVTDAGIPYLVMEYVDGVPITRYAARCDLSVRQRVELFLTVCRAVEAAHRNLIVHRDIKPSNVLVSDDGVVKLLDFGIAKLIEEDDPDITGTRGVFTPHYAAPEQINGGTITTATDVYGLGVMLHELLLGIRPEGSPTRRPSSRVLEAIRTTEGDAGAAQPTQLRTALRGDLDNILLKALDNEPERRYPSAGAFADDIERYLKRRPVLAHPPSRWYRTAKFAQRHRGGVVLTSVFVLALFAALGVTVWQANVARREAARANTVRDFVVGLFDAARAHLPRDQRPTPEALVDQAQQQIDQINNIDPLTHAELLRTLGEVQLSLSNFTRAERLFDQASVLVARDTAIGNDLHVMHADAQQRAGHNAEAVAELDPLLPKLRAAPDGTLLRALGVRAAADLVTGKADAALAYRREAAAAAQRIHGADDIETMAAQLEVGNTLAAMESFPATVALLQPVLERWRAAQYPEDDRYVAALGSLATATDGIGDKPDSEARFRELLALKRRIYTAPHDAIATTLRDLALVLSHAEKFDEADALLAEALAMEKTIYGENHREVAATYHAMGEVKIAQLHYTDGDVDYRHVIAICETANIREAVCAAAHNDLGMSLYHQLKPDAAAAEMTIALNQRRAWLGDDSPTVAYSMATLANVAIQKKEFATALRLSSDALDILQRDGRDASREAALIRFSYAQALWMADRLDDALREIDQALIAWQRVAPEGKARRVAMLVQKAQILSELKRDADARKAAEEGIAAGAVPQDLTPMTKKLLRELSGRTDVFPDVAVESPQK